MSRGIAIVIGVRAAPIFQTYNLPVLEYAELDACKMAGIARDLGYEVHALIGPEATVEALDDAVNDAAAALKGQDDTLLLSFSGHGVKLPGGVCEKVDDEHWCLYDGLVVDDLIRAYWDLFPCTARVYTVADCCYSGEIAEWIHLVEVLQVHAAVESQLASSILDVVPGSILRLFTDVGTQRRRVLRTFPDLNCDPPAAQVLLLASVASGEAQDGLFMRGFRQAWLRSDARKSFTALRDAIEAEVSHEKMQIPALIPRDSPLTVMEPFALPK